MTVPAAMLILIILFSPCALAYSGASSGTDGILKEQAQKSGISSLPDKLPAQAKKALEKMGVKGPLSLSAFTPSGIISFCLSSLKNDVKAPAAACGAVLGILLICTLAGTFGASQGAPQSGGSPAQVAGLVSTLCIITLLAPPLLKCFKYCGGVIKSSSAFSLALIPVFTALTAASGHPASAAVYHGLLMAVCQFVSVCMSTFFIPMAGMYLAFCVIGSISPGVDIGSIAAFVRKTACAALIGVMTVFTGILTVQSVISQATDSVSLKTAKFIVGSAVPVIGGAVSDAVNTVLGCAGILRSAAGAFAIASVIILFLPPLIDCGLWMIACGVSALFADMLGAAGAASLLRAVGEAVKLVAALVFACAMALTVSFAVTVTMGMNT
jgi:stage III sporulation protein AE